MCSVDGVVAVQGGMTLNAASKKWTSGYASHEFGHILGLLHTHYGVSDIWSSNDASMHTQLLLLCLVSLMCCIC